MHRSSAGRRTCWRRGVLALLPFLLAAMVIRRIRIAVGMRRGDQIVIEAKRTRNKRLANRLVNTLGRARRRGSIFAVIHVTGAARGGDMPPRFA